MNDTYVMLQAKLDEAKSKNSLNRDIAKLQAKLDKIKLQAQIDPRTIESLTRELEVIINPKIKMEDAKKEQEELASGFAQITDLWDKLGEESQEALLENFFGESHTQISSAIELFDALRESVNALQEGGGDGGWMLALGILVEKLGASNIFKNIGKGRISVRISKPINC